MLSHIRKFTIKNTIKNNVKFYHKNIIDHYENPKNVGSLDKNKKSVGTSLVGAPACGDVMKLQIEVKDGKIIDSKFKTFGCGSAIASSSYGSEYIKGMLVEDALNVSNHNYLLLNYIALCCLKMQLKELLKIIKKRTIYRNNFTILFPPPALLNVISFSLNSC